MRTNTVQSSADQVEGSRGRDCSSCFLPSSNKCSGSVNWPVRNTAREGAKSRALFLGADSRSFWGDSGGDGWAGCAMSEIGSVLGGADSCPRSDVSLLTAGPRSEASLLYWCAFSSAVDNKLPDTTSLEIVVPPWNDEEAPPADETVAKNEENAASSRFRSRFLLSTWDAEGPATGGGNGFAGDANPTSDAPADGGAESRKNVVPPAGGPCSRFEGAASGSFKDGECVCTTSPPLSSSTRCRLVRGESSSASASCGGGMIAVSKEISRPVLLQEIR